MNLKRFFGAILTVLGTGGLLYAAFFFVSAAGTNKDVKILLIYGVLGILFFGSGIHLVQTIKDES